jgi:hypothetical protein
VFPYRYETAAIPEPSTVALFGAGTLAAFFGRRRREASRRSDDGALSGINCRLLADIGIGHGEALSTAHEIGVEQLRRAPAA